MSDFSKARSHMVDCQIHTNGVTNNLLLQSFETIPRERFVPEPIAGVAYQDEDLVFPDGRFLLSPMIHARMIQALDLKPDDVVLDIGGGMGYSSAILSPLVSTVIMLEETKPYIDHAIKLWDEMTLCNIAAIKGKLVKGHRKNAPYNAIIMNGAVHEIPLDIVNQLEVGGNLICILRPDGAVMGQVTLVRALGKDDYCAYNLMEAGCPYLPGFEPPSAFSF